MIEGDADIGLFVEFFAIDQDSLEVDINGIPRQTDHPFDVVLRSILRIVEDNDITTCRRTEEIGCLIDHHEFAGMQAWFHTCTVNIIALDDKTNDEENKQCECHYFDDFTH